MEKSKIILTAEAEFIDAEARKIIEKLNTRIETLNQRTKIQTLQIKNLEKQVREKE